MLFTARTYAAASKTKGGAVITLGNNATYYSTIAQGGIKKFKNNLNFYTIPLRLSEIVR